MYSGQDINSGLQPAMSQAPITSGSGPIILAPTEKKPKRWPIIIGVIFILIAIGTGVAALVLMKSKPVLADVTKAYIEYFVYGTEGENQVNEATFEMNSDSFAIKNKLENYSSKESSEYFEKLFNKYEVLYKTGKDKIGKNLLADNGVYLKFYKAIMQTLNSDFLASSFSNNVSVNDLYNNLSVEEEDEFLKNTYDLLNEYANDWYASYTKVKEWGCMTNEGIDYNCIWGVGEGNNVSFGSANTNKELTRRSNVLYGMLDGVLDVFYKQGVGSE